MSAVQCMIHLQPNHEVPITSSYLFSKVNFENGGKEVRILSFDKKTSFKDFNFQLLTECLVGKNELGFGKKL